MGGDREVGEGVAGVDLLIGEADLTGGLGPRVLADLVERVFFAQPEALACVAAVDEENQRPWREKAGFTYARDIEEEGRPHRLMRLDRGYAQ